MGSDIGDGHDPEAGDDDPGEEAENAEQPEQEFEAGVFDACCPVAGLQEDKYTDRDVDEEADAGEPLAGGDFEAFLFVHLDSCGHTEEYKKQFEIEKLFEPM